ncbi:MAG TPA: SAM-dependent DNA methyltransferase, partial [Verrucomicrobiae bacterium]|nr:SAM-dependent DNA methyltransferase [Verrucomicrobiae bacterium]
FDNAEVLPSIVIFRNRVPSLDAQVLFTVGGTLNSPVTTETVLLRDLSADQKWKLPFKDRASQRSSGFRIKDLFKIRRGIATGANDFFILERKVARELGLPEIALKPVLPKSRVLNEAVIQRDSDGYPKVEPKLCVIDCSLTETEIARKYRRLARYLSTAKDRNILKRNLIRNRTPWYKQEVRAPAPFLCTYMGRGRKGLPPIHFYWNKSDAIATNTYLMLYPNPSLAKILEENEKRGEELLDMLQKAARTTVLEQSRLHAGGLRKIEPKELGNVTLLDVPAWVPQSDSSLFLEI